MFSFRLRGLDDGGRGGSGLFNLAAEAGEGFGSGGKELGSDGGAFSLEGFCFREGRIILAALGFGEGGGSVSLKIVFLGCMKCFIAVGLRASHQRF